jgi:SAM-dependent methyltransferase
MLIWASGEAYESYIGRWSRPVAREFLQWLAAPRDVAWLDVACGTGALTETILQFGAPSSVQGIDGAVAYVDHARQRVHDPRATFFVADAQALPQLAQTIDVIVSALALNFFPQPDIALSEMRRVARPGGIIAIYVWDYAGEMQLLRYFWDAATALDPSAAALDEGVRFPICNPTVLKRLFRDAAFEQVESRPIDVATPFRDFDDYWMPFMSGQGPAPGYVRSLNEERVEALRERLRVTLPTKSDGSIHLIARAWVVKGRVSATSTSVNRS